MTNDLITVRLEIEGMRYTIIHAFAQHNTEIEKAVAEEVERVIKNFNFRAEVERAATDALRRSVTNACDRFLLYGDGQKMVQELTDKALSAALKPTRGKR